MIKLIILRILKREEKRLGQSVDYLRHMLNVSPRAFFRFTKIASISKYRGSIPSDAYHVAAIIGTRDEDCGTCVQIAVNLAKFDGVPGDVLKAVIDSKPEQLNELLRVVYHFAEAVVQNRPEADDLRQSLIRHYGQKAPVDLSLAIASARFYPIVKRTLGYGKSCALVTIDI